MKKISVIVPIYDVEKYIRRCVESIIAQSYQELEIILVDDGSIDKSGEICEEYARLDTRICIIHQENKGLSEARTAGLLHATGEMIAFVDADDWCAKNMYQKLYDNMQSQQAEISCCELKSVSSEKEAEKQEQRKESISVYEAVEFVNRLFRNEEGNYMGNKLFRKEILLAAWKPFPKNRFAEDMAVLYRVLAITKRVVTCTTPLYYYFQNEKGICATPKESIYQSYLLNLSEMEQFYSIREKPKEFDRYRIFLLLRAYVELCKWNALNHIKNKKLEGQVRGRFLEAYRRMSLSDILQDKHRIKIVLVRLNLMKMLIIAANSRK